jgi:hypothetical protein
MTERIGSTVKSVVYPFSGLTVMDPLRQRVNRPVRIQEARHMRQFYLEARMFETDTALLLDNENLTFRYGSGRCRRDLSRVSSQSKLD